MTWDYDLVTVPVVVPMDDARRSPVKVIERLRRADGGSAALCGVQPLEGSSFRGVWQISKAGRAAGMLL